MEVSLYYYYYYFSIVRSFYRHGTYLLIYLFILYLLLLKHDIKSSVIVQWDSEIIKNIFSSPWSFIMSSGVYGDVV